MSKMSGDLIQIGVGRETTRGTAIAPAYEVHWGDLETRILKDPSAGSI